MSCGVVEVPSALADSIGAEWKARTKTLGDAACTSASQARRLRSVLLSV
jgi:hypothetical protein